MRYIAIVVLFLGSIGTLALAEERREEGLVSGCWCMCKTGVGMKSIFVPVQAALATHADCQKKLKMAGNEEFACPGNPLAGSLLSGTCSAGFGPSAQ